MEEDSAAVNLYFELPQHAHFQPCDHVQLYVLVFDSFSSALLQPAWRLRDAAVAEAFPLGTPPLRPWCFDDSLCLSADPFLLRPASASLRTARALPKVEGIAEPLMERMADRSPAISGQAMGPQTETTHDTCWKGLVLGVGPRPGCLFLFDYFVLSIAQSL